MATKLTKFDFSAPSSLTAPGEEKAAYPWEEWFDGDTWKLTWGEDFDPHPLMMERIIRTRATGRKARVRVRHLALNGKEGSNDPTGIIVMERVDIAGPDQEKRAKKAEQSRERRAVKAPSKAPSKKAPARK